MQADDSSDASLNHRIDSKIKDLTLKCLPDLQMPPEQEIVELNLKVLVPDERNKKQESLEVKF